MARISITYGSKNCIYGNLWQKKFLEKIWEENNKIWKKKIK
jgi:hypothetical protein